MDNLIADVIGDTTLVLLVSSLFGAAARRFRQPSIIGQILARILLGPSLLGHLPGHLSSRLFPHGALPYLSVISQVAVALFIFGVGYELNRKSLPHGYRAAVLVAAAALAVPMLLGSGSVLVFRSAYASLGQSRSGHSQILFMGVATSITALPVLAAIMRERGISGTAAGATATTAAGIMDVAAWIMLAAALVGIADTPGRSWPAMLMLVAGFAAVMLLGVRPALRWWFRRPVFGGLLAGFTMPTQGRRRRPGRASDHGRCRRRPAALVFRRHRPVGQRE